MPLAPVSAGATLPQQLARKDFDRFRRYKDNLDFYKGPGQWTGAPRKRERRLTFNYAKAVVDKTSSYLMSGLDIAVDPPADTEGGKALARRTEAALRDVYEDNNLAQLDFDTEIDTSVLGDGAFKVTWDVGLERVRVTAPDVQGLFAWWRSDDLGTVWRVAQRWAATASELSATLGVPVASSKADGAVSVLEVWTDSTLEIWADARVIERRENPYGFIPYVIIPNLREAKAFWGVSDLESIKEPAKELNRALSQLSLIMELSGNPIAVLENVADSTNIAVAPGAVWEVPERARAYLLDLLEKGGVGFHKDYVEILYRTLHDLGETPRTAFGDNRHALSGTALNTELDPLLKKVTRKRLIRGAAYKRRNELILRIVEQFTGESFAPYRSRIVWGAVLPQDRSRSVNDERALVEAGIHSRRRAADSLGVEDPEGEYARWLEEEEAARAVGVPPMNPGHGRQE